MLSNLKLTNTQRRLLVIGLALVLIAIGVGLLRRADAPSERVISLNELAQRVASHDVTEIRVTNDGGKVMTRSGEVLNFYAGRDSILKVLTNFGVSPAAIANVTFTVAEPPAPWLGLLLTIGPLVLFGLVIVFAWRRMGDRGGNPMMSFGRSRARTVNEQQPGITFLDVAGVEEPRQELQEIVEFLKEPPKFVALGARIPRGVLLVGPPGTGKTLLARAVAGEGGVAFFHISGSEFVEMFVGVGASRVRDLFDQAKRNAPAIVFVDEIDAVGRQRGSGLGGSHDEREQTLNQILVEMDGFDTNSNVIVIAATNRPDILDPALLRPGRFDRQVVIDAPDVKGRVAILEVHAKGKPLDKDVSLDKLARTTPGFTGADIENVINEAAILAARHNRKAIIQQDFQEAVEKVVAGPERKSRIISARERRIIAHHEAGHALVARLLPNTDPVHKVSIVARGQAGGFTMLLPTEDRYLWSKPQFEDMLGYALGGRVAEVMIFGVLTTGASKAVERVTKIARSMVTEYGMSSRIGPMALGHKEELVFLGRDFGEQRNYSE